MEYVSKRGRHLQARCLHLTRCDWQVGRRILQQAPETRRCLKPLHNRTQQRAWDRLRIAVHALDIPLGPRWGAGERHGFPSKWGDGMRGWLGHQKPCARAYVVVLIDRHKMWTPSEAFMMTMRMSHDHEKNQGSKAKTDTRANERKRRMSFHRRWEHLEDGGSLPCFCNRICRKVDND